VGIVTPDGDDVTNGPERPLPEGTLTFVLTDIEDSTRQWDDEPSMMAGALRRHDELVSSAIEATDGWFVKSKGEGDSTFSVFVDPVAAVTAAELIRDSIEEEPWPPGLTIRVRIGVLTGVAELRDGDYFGAAVNRAARVRSLASGGEILLAASTYALVADSLLRNRVIDDRGEHELRGLQRPERVYALLDGEKTPVAVAPAPATRRRGRMFALVAGIAVVAAVGLGLFLALRGGDGNGGHVTSPAAASPATTVPLPNVLISSVEVSNGEGGTIRYEVTGSATRVESPPYQVRVLARDPEHAGKWFWSPSIPVDKTGRWKGALIVGEATPGTLPHLKVSAVVILPPKDAGEGPTNPQLPFTGPSALEDSLFLKGPAAPGVVAVSDSRG